MVARRSSAGPWTLPILSAGLIALACSEEQPAPAPVELPSLTVEVDPQPAILKRLTAVQYRNIVADVFGGSVVAPASLEPDSAVGGLIAVGATHTTISPWGVEQYENAAYSIAEQAMSDEASRAALVPCTPNDGADRGCIEAFVTTLGRRLWRRPLSAEELAAIADVTADGATTLGDFYKGLELAIAALLQSPNFLFRVEIGKPSPEDATRRDYDPYEMATRLSFLFWNTSPDETLLDAAERGELDTADGLKAQAERLLASPRAAGGVRTFFMDLYGLHELDRLSKDPILFPHFSSDFGEAAREETLLVLDEIVFTKDADFRDFFTTNETFVTRRLASLYGVKAPVHEGFGRVTLPIENRRRGFLGQASFLALRSHAVASSPTLRGKFIEEVLLCKFVPPPPVNVNTAIPEVSETAKTLRDRLKQHLTDPSCTSCHLSMDTVGLGFENFDGVGKFRTVDNGEPIDSTGHVDGTPFSDSWELAELVREHPNLARCFVSNVYRYATGNENAPGERALIDVLTERFVKNGHRVQPLLVDIAQSAGFRQAGESSE